MKPYTESEPVFSESIQVTEPTDPAHADNINAGPKQLLQNTLVNKKEIEDLKQGNNEVEFDDTIPGEGEEPGGGPDPAETLEQITSGKSVPVLIGHIKRTLTGLLSLSQRALNIAMGKNQARVFATVDALDAWLSVPEHTAELKVGDNFYITAVDVPDYWWDGTQKQKLETQKVDLTTYDQKIAALEAKDSELNGNISSHNHDGRYYTESEVNSLLAGKAGTSHRHDWSAITGRTPGTSKTVVSNKTVSVANGWKLVNLVSFKTPPGVWLILVQAYWDGFGVATVAQNARGLYISNSTTSISNQADERIAHESHYAHQMYGIVRTNAEQTFYILARQNFSSAINVTVFADMVRLD